MIQEYSNILVNNSQLQARSHRFLLILGTTLSSPEPPNLSTFAWFCRFFHRFGENFHGLFSNNQLQLQNLSIKLKNISQILQYSAFSPCFFLNVWDTLSACSLANYLKPTELECLVVLWLSRWSVTFSGFQD